MAGLPLHPAVVHIPIGVAVLAPVLAGALLVALWRRRAERRAWNAVVLVQAVVLAGALLALRTGHSEEERVEGVVSERAIDVHEERAEAFTWIAAIATVSSVAVLLVPGRSAMLATAAAATLASGLVLGAAAWVGHSGGDLVYRQGAAAASGVSRDSGQARRDVGEDVD